jgi:hypothetical protein
MTSEELGNQITIDYELSTLNSIGETVDVLNSSISVDYKPWMQKSLEALEIQIPDVKGLGILKFWVKSKEGKILHRNFMHFVIKSDTQIKGVQQFSVEPNSYLKEDWSLKQWDVLDGKKVNGAGKGYFEYEIVLDKGLEIKNNSKAFIIMEVSAKEFFVKDQKDFNRNQDYMLGSVVAPSSNPNSYPMTDETLHPSTVSFLVNGKNVLVQKLEDDPADHRGVLSWHSQLKDRKLREAGSYGYLVKIPLNKDDLRQFIKNGKVILKIETEGEDGLAIYGEDFGRFPFNPSLVIKEE